MRTDTQKALCKLLKGDYRNESSLELVRRVEGLVDALRRERDEMQGTINGLKHLVELPKSAGLTELFNAVEALELNKPQLNEIRYVLHGDIQPCTVLYSDDTTTLLRLDEGDIMCETDAIEWSDSVTYRCQELLKLGGVGRPVDILAQLVRDERILLNDNALETSGTVDLKVDSDIGVGQPVNVAAVVVPCPPAPASSPTCGNPYVHDSVEYPETAMRNAGWQTEDLVQMGYGHYKPVPLQRPQER